jgi:hypothetical protein
LNTQVVSGWRAGVLFGLAALAAAALSACGEAVVAANLSDPVAVATAYMQAVKGGDASAGVTMLEPKSDEKLTGDTPLSRYLAAHKNAPFIVVEVPWARPGTTTPDAPSKAACLIGKGGPDIAQICLVTVQLGSGDSAAFFRFVLENRYEPGQYHIIAVDEVKSATDGLPQGNEAHIEA